MRVSKKSLILAAWTAALISAATAAWSQPGETNESEAQQSARQSLIPVPGSKPDLYPPPRTMQRTGTAIKGARNSISIKSTDAGIIHYPPATIPQSTPFPQASAQSGCINCGVIDFIRIIGQENTHSAITSGIVAGTIAKEIVEHGAHPHSGRTGGHHPDYHVGVTMNDGTQQIIRVPDASYLHRGDSIQLIDGLLVPNHFNH